MGVQGPATCWESKRRAAAHGARGPAQVRDIPHTNRAPALFDASPVNGGADRRENSPPLAALALATGALRIR